jgi:hypothetical protein
MCLGERIEDLDRNDRILQVQDGVEQSHQRGHILRRAKIFLKAKSTVGLMPRIMSDSQE